MSNICFVIGTRPEFIKIIEVVNELKNLSKYKIKIIFSSQQNLLIKKYIDKKIFNYDMKINKFNSDSGFISSFLIKMEKLNKKIDIDYFFVQGDTNTAFATSLFGFLKKIPIIHLEAGLRTYNLEQPYPEEFNRQSITKMANIHLSQTLSSKQNLKKEGIDKNIFVVGNPGIDYLCKVIKKNKIKEKVILNSILITMHRRESLDGSLKLFVKNLKKFMKKNPHFKIFWPLHTNPNILKNIKDSFKSKENYNINFSEPMKYNEFLKILMSCEFVITDSGGIQEEAAFLGKKLLIARDVTERIDILKLKLGYLIMADGSRLQQTISSLKKKKINKTTTLKWKKMQGNGKSSKKVLSIFRDQIKNLVNKNI